MLTLLQAAVAGALVGGGVFAIARALTQSAPPLARVAADLQRPAVPALDATSRVEQVISRSAPWLMRRTEDPRKLTDLRVAGRTPAQQVATKLGVATALALMPMVATTALSFTGLGVPPIAGVLPAAGMAVLGWVIPDIEVRERAEARRTEFVAALSAYLDVVAILLAGGAGTETALYTAAEQGGGWAFSELRQALDRSRFSGVAPWSSMEQLGHELAVDELTELAAAAAVAGHHGAQVRESLTARAAGLRQSQLAKAEEFASATSERMTIPLALLGISFLGFIVFPAVWQIIVATG